MTSANNDDVLKTLILLDSCFNGIVSVTTSSVSEEFSSFSYAFPDKIAWVHTALTDFAPFFIIISAAVVSVVVHAIVCG